MSFLAVIGNNGSGKSNIIEALSHIFMGAFYNAAPDFLFKLTYKAHDKLVIIERASLGENFSTTVDGHNWGTTRFSRLAKKSHLMPPFPSLIFGYYSGTCERMYKQFKRYNRTYAAKLRSQSVRLERSFVFSDIDHAKWIVLGLFSQQNHELLNEISIQDIKNISFIIQPPKQYRIDIDDPSFWGTDGAIRDFLADIDNEANELETAGQQFNRQNQRSYILNGRGLKKVGDILHRRGTNFYSMILALVWKNMLIDIDYSLLHTDGNSEFSFDELSEGEKQLICVIGGLKLADQEECLVLLDEPDTHLNPAWSWRYNNLLKQALGDMQITNSTVLLATHDPVLISGLLKEQVLIAHERDGRLAYEHPYRDPRGQGIANVLTSEFFGLPSSLDENTQKLLDKRLELAYKETRLTNEEKESLSEINTVLDKLGLTISYRDPEYRDYEESKYQG